MGERCLCREVFLKCPRGDKGSAQTGSPWPVLYENSSIAQSLQRMTGMISPGTTHARTHRSAPLEERCWGKRWPQCETSVNKCAPGVKVQRTSIFSPASYSLQGTFEALAGWYGFALVATKFVYTYSTIHQLMLWCLEDVTDLHIGGVPGHTWPSMSFVYDLVNMQLITLRDFPVTQLCFFYFCCCDVKSQWWIYLKL